MSLPNEINNMCLIELLQTKQQLHEFYNLIFVCKEWFKIIFKHKLYIIIKKNTRLSKQYQFKDFLISIINPKFVPNDSTITISELNIHRNI